MSTDPRPQHLEGGKPAGHGDFLVERRCRVVAPFLEGRRLLDFGCGNGAQTLPLASSFEAVVGVDVELRRLGELLAHRDGRPVLPVLYDGHALPLPDASVDAAMSFEVLEHVEDEAQALREILRVLRPGGRLVMSVPNRWWIFETHGADLPLLPWNRVPFFSWLPKRVHDRWAHARIYRRREIVAKLRAAGFEVQRSEYVTAPMDVLKIAPLRRWLRATLFRPDTTPVPFLATAVLVVGRKPRG